MLILYTGYRQVTLRKTSKNSSRPQTDVNLLNCLLSCLNIGGIRIERTRAESSSYLKSTNGNATHNFLVVNNKNCLSRVPCREGGTSCLLRLPDVHLYCLVLYCCLFKLYIMFIYFFDNTFISSGVRPRPLTMTSRLQR